ncbi:MAG: hypothetical protein V4710_06875 [Verrucomicrobiota bacterium]
MIANSSILAPQTFVLLIPLAAVIGAFTVKILKILREKPRGSLQGSTFSSEERQTLERVAVMLDRMENRIEALETILIENAASYKPKNYSKDHV